MILRTIRTPVERLPRLAESTFQSGSVIGFKGSQAGFEEFAARHDDDVEARRHFVTSENLSYQPFSAISPYGAPKLFRRRDAQATGLPVVRQDEERAEPAMDSGAALVDLLKVDASANPLVPL
jgi:hypothetical protein